MTVYHAVIGTQFWSCEVCGAAVTEGAKSAHDNFHDSIDEMRHWIDAQPDQP